MILVANGCSHTAGAEMEYPSQRRCYEKAWPKYLAEKLGYNHVNLSDSGASGHRVVRTTMRYVLDQLKNKNNLQDHLFIINWPGAHRTELRIPQNVSVVEKPLFYDTLELNGLVELSETAAEHLCGHLLDVELKGLSELSDAAAKSLAKMATDKLRLTDELEKQVAKYR